MPKTDNPERKKSPKKRYDLRNKKKKSVKKQYKLAEDSDSDSDSDWLPEDALAASVSGGSEEVTSSEEDSGTEEELEEAFNAREFQRFVQKIFPSKSGKERLRQLENIDKMLTKKDKTDDGEKKKGKNVKLKTSKRSKNVKLRRRRRRRRRSQMSRRKVRTMIQVSLQRRRWMLW